MVISKSKRIYFITYQLFPMKIVIPDSVFLPPSKVPSSQAIYDF